jgi:hypothetical protein
MIPIKSDLQIRRILVAPTWRARFFEAAANAAASIVKYSIERQDAIATAIWLDRMRFFRNQAVRNSGIQSLEQV